MSLSKAALLRMDDLSHLLRESASVIDRLVSTLGIVGIATLAALAGALAVGLVLVLRERSHRRRVNRLFSRLRELEQLMPQGAEPGNSSRLPEAEALSPNPKAQLVSIRGRFSTLVSSLRRRSMVNVGEPNRLDVRAVRYLYAHLEHQATPSELASELNVSLRTLQRQISEALGCSPRDLIVAVKMHEAKRLLANGDRQVAEVARAVGFDDAFYFSKRFRAYYGLPPSQLRKAS